MPFLPWVLTYPANTLIAASVIVGVCWSSIKSFTPKLGHIWVLARPLTGKWPLCQTEICKWVFNDFFFQGIINQDFYWLYVTLPNTPASATPPLTNQQQVGATCTAAGVAAEALTHPILLSILMWSRWPLKGTKRMHVFSWKTFMASTINWLSLASGNCGGVTFF